MLRQRGNQLYVALGALIAVALLLAAVAWYVERVRAEAFAAGETAERGRWQAREAEELQKLNGALLAAQARADELERQAAADLAAAEQRRLKEVADAEARKDAFVSAVVRGDIRLFDPCRSAREGADRGAAGEAAAAPAGGNGEADLRRAYAQRVGRSIELAEQADALIVEAQQTIQAYLKACDVARPP